MLKKRDTISINDKQSNKKRQFIMLAILMILVGIFFFKTMYDKRVEAQKIQQEEKITKWVKTAYEDGYLTEEATQVLSDVQEYMKENSLENEGFIFKTGFNELEEELVLKDSLNDLFEVPIIVTGELKKNVVLKDFNMDKEVMASIESELHEYSKEEKYNKKIYEQFTQTVKIAEEQGDLGEYAVKESIKKNKESEDLRSYLKSSNQLNWEQFNLISPSVVGKYKLIRSGKISNMNFSLEDLETITAIGKMSDEFVVDISTNKSSIELTADGKQITYYDFYSTNLDIIKTTIETANYLFRDNDTLIVGTSNQSEDYSFYAKLYKGRMPGGGSGLLQKYFLENNQEKQYINIYDYPKVEETDSYMLLDLTKDYLGRIDELRKEYGNQVMYIDREVLYQIAYYEDSVSVYVYTKI